MKAMNHSAATAPVRFAISVLSHLASAVMLLASGAVVTASAQTNDATALPDMQGAWQSAQTYQLLKTSDGKTPPLTPEARKVYEANIASRKKGDLSFDGTATLCRPPGVPRTLTVAPFRILQDSYLGTTVFLSEWNKLRRPIPVGRKHRNEDQVYFMGDSVGTWEGDVLVVDSNQHNDSTLLDSALPHSEDLHIVERIRLVDNNTLEDALSITDPETFTAPWTTVLRFKRLPSDRPFPIDVCTDRVVTPLTVDAEIGMPKH